MTSSTLGPSSSNDTGAKVIEALSALPATPSPGRHVSRVRMFSGGPSPARIAVIRSTSDSAASSDNTG
jgi:hypothetical protein